MEMEGIMCANAFSTPQHDSRFEIEGSAVQTELNPLSCTFPYLYGYKMYVYLSVWI